MLGEELDVMGKHTCKLFILQLIPEIWQNCIGANIKC